MKTMNFNQKLMNEKHVLKYVPKNELQQAVNEAVTFVQENIDSNFAGLEEGASKSAMYSKFVEAVNRYNEAVKAEEEKATVNEPAPIAETEEAPVEKSHSSHDAQYRLDTYTAELKEKEAIENPDAATKKRIASLHRKIKRAEAALKRNAANAARLAAKEAKSKNK